MVYIDAMEENLGYVCERELCKLLEQFLYFKIMTRTHTFSLATNTCR